MSDFKIVSLYITKENIAALLTGKKLYSMINGDEYAITIEMKDENKTHNTDTLEANEWNFAKNKLEQEPIIDKIRAEIESYKLSEDELSDMDEDSVKWGMKIAYDIINKYKTESEE